MEHGCKDGVGQDSLRRRSDIGVAAAVVCDFKGGVIIAFAVALVCSPVMRVSAARRSKCSLCTDALLAQMVVSLEYLSRFESADA